MTEKMMDKFDFEKMKGHEPYSVPDGLFEQIEANVWREVKDDLKPQAKPTAKRRMRIVRWMTAVAAAVALFMVVRVAVPTQPNDDYAAVEQAFSQLSAADQAYLMEAYQEDVFIENL